MYGIKIEDTSAISAISFRALLDFYSRSIQPDYNDQYDFHFCWQTEFLYDQRLKQEILAQPNREFNMKDPSSYTETVEDTLFFRTLDKFKV